MTAPSVDPLAKSFLQGRSGSLDDALISLCDHVEALASGSIAGLTICNPSRTHIERAVFPRLPQFATAIRAIPLSPSDFGSCVQAIAHGEIITCHDIAEEKRFDPQWQRLCLDHGVRSLQSRPVCLSPRAQTVCHVRACLHATAHGNRLGCRINEVCRRCSWSDYTVRPRSH